jgi:hypothetical protein
MALTAVINSDISITNVASATVFSTPKDVTYTITVINAVSDATVNLTLSNPSSGAVIVPGASATLGAQSTATLTILAGPPMLLGPAALPDAEVGIAYANQDITASGEPGRG